MLSFLLQGEINARSTKARAVARNPMIRSLNRRPSPKRAVVKSELLAVRNGIQISESTQPLRFVRSSRNDHGPIRPRRLGQIGLLVEPLVRAERRLCSEHIRGDISVLFRGAGCRLSVGPVEDAERKLPEHSASERDNHLIASSLHGSPAQRRENAHSAEPTHNVVADGNNGRLLRADERPFESKDPRHRCTNLIKARPVRPRPRFSVKNDGGVDESRLFRTYSSASSPWDFK